MLYTVAVAMTVGHLNGVAYVQTDQFVSNVTCENNGYEYQMPETSVGFVKINTWIELTGSDSSKETTCYTTEYYSSNNGEEVELEDGRTGVFYED